MLQAADLRTRSGGRRPAAASARTPRPPPPASKKVVSGITSLVSASARRQTPVLQTLASLNLLLISIIVVLVRKHRKMTRRLREQPSHVPGEMSKNLYSPPPGNSSEPPSVKAD